MVFVGGLWWFIFLFWVCWSVVGYSIGKWILIELKGSYCIKFDVLKSLFDFLLNKFVCSKINNVNFCCDFLDIGKLEFEKMIGGVVI